MDDTAKKYSIYGGHHGNYDIWCEGVDQPVAFVTRNRTGGGYTVRNSLYPLSKQRSITVQMPKMPVFENSTHQATQIMEFLLKNLEEVENKMNNKDAIIQALTEARKTSTDNADMIAKATFALNVDFFDDGLSMEEATQIVAGTLYEHSSGLVFEESSDSNEKLRKSLELDAECTRYMTELGDAVFLQYTLYIKKYGKNKVTPYHYEDFKSLLKSFYIYTVNAFTLGDLEKPDGTFWESSQHSFDAWKAHHGLSDRTASSIFRANDDVESYS